MRTLGLVGGTSWVSTAEYYRIINQQVHKRLGGRHSAKVILYSVDFEEFTPPPDPAAWGHESRWFTNIALRLQTAGADCILLCANTPHMAAEVIQRGIAIPLIHIAEVTAQSIRAQNIKRVGLLGTKLTMEQPFFTDRLHQAGISALLPEGSEREYIHTSIFAELGVGNFNESTKKRYLEVIKNLVGNGAEGIVFACTEIPLLIKPEECPVPVFDTTLLHATAAVEFALKG